MSNNKFAINGINHLAAVCEDMERTVHFYQDILGMPLVKTINLASGGQHFFFDCGNGTCIAFFWFPDGPDKAPGIAAPKGLPGSGLHSACGSMNHLAFDVPAETLQASMEALQAEGIEVLGVLNHDDSTSGVAREFHDGVFLQSIYFQDPDGILLEFTGWTRDLGPDEASDPPMTAGDRVGAS